MKGRSPTSGESPHTVFTGCLEGPGVRGFAVCARFPDASASEMKEHFMQPQRLCARIRPSMMRITTDPETTVRVSRTFRVPLSRMFDAWTDMSMLREWWGPFPDGEGDTHDLIFQPRAYGEFHWVFSDAAGGLHTVTGEVFEVVTREKILLSWIASEGMPHLDQDDHHTRDGRRRHIEDADLQESAVNIDFREGQGIEVRIQHTDLPDRATRDALEAGWRAALERLEEFLQRDAQTEQSSAEAKCA